MRPTIVVIEQNDTVRDILKDVLRQWFPSYEVCVFTNHLDALGHIKEPKKNTHLIITNLGNRKDGFNFLRDLRTQRGNFPPILVCTGWDLSQADLDTLKALDAIVIVKGRGSLERLQTTATNSLAAATL